MFVAPPGLVSAAERETAVLAIESFVIRRMLAKDQTRAYGQVFVEVLKAMQKAARPALAVIETLRSAPHGYAWTSFDDIAESFATSRYYGPGGINQERLRLVLGAVDERLQTLAKKTESITIDYSGLQVEHVIPRGWRQYWPVVMDDPVAQQVAEQARERQVHRIGNLTLATGPLNSSLSNDPWEAKRAELRKHSKLQLNALLVEHDDWNDDRIADRSAWLAQQVDAIWPGPDSDRWSM